MRVAVFPLLLVICVSLGCARHAFRPAAEPTVAQLQSAAAVGIDAPELVKLLNTPLFEMQLEAVDRYLTYLQRTEPQLRKRVAALARKNIGQPYELYLLGEFPFETFDNQPLFSLEKSDCVVFVEHTYAMALSRSWPEFFWMLQRMRYKDGVIGVTTRNHYTETDWNVQNAWLVTDITAQLAGPHLATYGLKVDRARFLRNRYQVDRDIPVETAIETYLPKENLAVALAGLQEGDYVNVISGKNGNYWAGHTGLVVIGPDGERRLIHSQAPEVREESFADFIARTEAREAGTDGAKLAGFKFLRLIANPQVPPMQAQPRPAGGA